MTTTFVCDQCETIDEIQGTPQETSGWVCSQCKNGTWHNYFPPERYDPNTSGPMLNRVNRDLHPDL